MINILYFILHYITFICSFSSRPSSRSSYNDRDREYYMRARDPYYAYNGTCCNIKYIYISTEYLLEKF